MYDKWGSTMSSKFYVTKDARQVSILSPLLFNVYGDDFYECLNISEVGGSMNRTFVIHILLVYADDICNICLCSSGLQQLFNIM